MTRFHDMLGGFCGCFAKSPGTANPSAGHDADSTEASPNPQQQQWHSEVPEPPPTEIKNRLEHCLENHACGPRSDAVLPSRVLDVGEANGTNIQLVQTHTGTIKTGQFVALSYCWGAHPPFVTTPGTLEARMQGFDVRMMPQTLRDAVHITRSLGFRYLWIDALCILQGDSAEAVRDWEVESAQMEQIYGNAVITIVAAWASHCNGGIIRPPRPERLGGESSTRREFRSEPINSRAWALQEWLLSSRVATFTSTGAAYFHCSSPRDGEPPAHFGHKIYRFRFPLPPKEPSPLNWIHILGNYTSRNLTNARDKLPAMAGLVRRYDSLTGFKNGRYLAGLWEASLLGELLWRRDDLFVAFFNPPQPSKTRTGQAPSWSWASVNGIIAQTTYFATGRMPPYVAEVVSCEVVHATADPYSMVSSGKLIIRGPAKPLPADSIRVDDSGTPRLYDGTLNVGAIYLDLEDEVAIARSRQARALSCLLVCTRAYHHGLLLQQVGESPDMYERVGLVVSSGNEEVAWWGDTEHQTFTIV
ncbi:heterokaryon incompatibility protein-domain-containing protein [Immersiella caudata]|uniref:Heterokaryon incompatibility protein-domain-containing protein n=1 Tax=Immersiella caudata TaxID=314043 RepID=A0AA39WWA0_9PEZI|nr:heterokaryon incompatibility protein-domain-containing protein [Immersiella caudata]